MTISTGTIMRNESTSISYLVLHSSPLEISMTLVLDGRHLLALSLSMFSLILMTSLEKRSVRRSELKNLVPTSVTSSMMVPRNIKESDIV